MQIRTRLASPGETLPLRTRHRQEMNCQIVHDSIHRREGWTQSHLLELDGSTVGFGSVAVAGPWTGHPAVFEFYVLPQHRTSAFDLFEAFLPIAGARSFEVQSNDMLLTVMLHAYGSEVSSEKTVFQDGLTTALPTNGAVLRMTTPEAEFQNNLKRRQGGGEWLLEVDGTRAGKGGILFHYNRPYGDIYMEIEEPFRRRGLGAYLVQELKRACYRSGAIPGARCNTSNIASRRTLMRAGFVPFAHILRASIATEPHRKP